MDLTDFSDDEMIDLVLMLWTKMNPAAFFSLRLEVAPPNAPSRQEVAQSLTRYIDYLNGRCIKTDFRNRKYVSTGGYNRDAGSGAFERCVDSIRSKRCQ